MTRIAPDRTHISPRVSGTIIFVQNAGDLIRQKIVRLQETRDLTSLSEKSVL